jgi:diguanylate cyclase (GGDEF)-like protein/PAS domain S-box-containing protein
VNDNCKSILESIPDALLIVDYTGDVKYLNSTAESMFGYLAEELLDKPINQLLPTNQRKEHAEQMSKYMESPSARVMGSRMNMSAINRKGKKFPVDIVLNTVTYEDKPHIICIVRDMTTLKLKSDELEAALKRESNLARYDPLTRVANRRLFNEHLKTMFHLSQRVGFIFTLVLIDIDDFKSINDRFGHTIGDEVLVRTAETLKDCTRRSDLVSRFGGDEFAVFLEHSSTTSIESIVTKMHESLHALYEASEWPISASFGALCCDVPPSTPEKVLEITDRILYEAKTAGKSTFRLYYLKQCDNTN